MPPQNTKLNKKVPNRGKRRPAPKVSKNVRRYVGSTVRRVMSAEQEHKYYLAFNTVTPSTVGTTYSLSDIPQGTSDVQRVGDKVSLGSLRLNYTLKRNTSSIQDTTSVRIFIFQWADSDSGGAPAAIELYQAPLYPMTTTLRHDPLRAKTLQVLYDKVITIDADDPSSVNGIVLKMRKRTLQYDTGGPTGTNKVFMNVICDDVYGPSMEYFAKLNFTDS